MEMDAIPQNSPSSPPCSNTSKMFESTPGLFLFYTAWRKHELLRPHSSFAMSCRKISKEFSFCQTDRRKDNLFAGTAYLFPTCTCVQSKKLCCHLAQLCEWQLVLRSLDSYASWQFPVWNSRVNVVFVDYQMTNCIYCNDALNCRT